MSHTAPSAGDLPRLQPGEQPQTFLDRGVAVPYTTPALLGARLRRGGRAPLELIVPNISGGAGVYMLPLDGAATLCQPTLHDRALNARLSLLPTISPESVRAASCAVAAEGLAGLAVAESARSALANEERQSVLATRLMLIWLLLQIEPRGPGWEPPEQADPRRLPARALAALGALAPRVGRSAEQMVVMLEQLGQQFRGVGVGVGFAQTESGGGEQQRGSPVGQLIEMLGQLSAELRQTAPTLEVAVAKAAETIATMAGQAADAATVAMQDARALLADMPELLARWAGERDTAAWLIMRAEWLLDGWERICLLWQSAPDRADRSRTVLEMHDLVPSVPLEAAQWLAGRAALPAEQPRLRKIPRPRQDWRIASSIVDQIERNEFLSAMSAARRA